MNQEKREHWKSHMGFVLAAAGSAIGLGNIWRFPYIAGENGGAAFVLLYLICIVLVGLPVMLCEFVVGRSTEKDPVGAYSDLSRRNVFWRLVGFMGVASGFLILSYYSVVGGWTLAYILEGATGRFSQLSSPDLAWGNFLKFTGHPYWPIVFHGFFIALCVGTVHSGVRKGIERWCDILMPALFVLLLILIVRAVTLPGARAGVAFLLKPDFSKITTQAFLVALGHAFFSLSLGMGAMITYGSYVEKKENLWKATAWVAGLDTMVALLAGLAIFPAVFAIGFDPAVGPGLIFKVLPAVFARMPGGAYLWGTLFFVLLAIAALTSGFSLLEVVTAYFVDEKGYPRHKVSIIAGIAIFLLGIPCALSFGPMQDVKFFNRTVFDSLDFLTSNILLPLGGLLICIFAGWVWGVKPALEEANAGAEGMRCKAVLGAAWKFLVRYVSPVAVVLVFLFSLGLISF